MAVAVAVAPAAKSGPSTLGTSFPSLGIPDGDIACYFEVGSRRFSRRSSPPSPGIVDEPTLEPGASHLGGGRSTKSGGGSSPRRFFTK
jgi:hypothetical protein